MPILPVPTVVGEKSASNVDYRDRLMVNRTVVVKPVKGDDGYHISHPGLTLHGEATNTGAGIDRGGAWNSRFQKHLRISGTSLIEVDSDGTTTFIGTVPGTTQASLPYSFLTQGILSDTRFYLYDGVQLTEVTDQDLGNPTDAVWINGIYVFIDGEFIYHTQATDEKSIEPERFGSSEFSPDRIIGLIVTKQNQLIVLNRFSIEWFTDTGGTGFRFRRVQGKSIKIGIPGPHCKTELNDQLFILGNRIDESPSIYQVAGGGETKIATREVEEVLEEYSDADLAKTVLETRSHKADQFIIIRLLNHTLIWNYTVAKQFGNRNAWGILKSDVIGDAPWRARNGVHDPRISKWIYGDSMDARIGMLDETTNLQYGEKAEELFYTPIINLETRSINGFEMDSLPGYAANEVTCMFSLSYDGVIFGTEYPVEVSKPNNYNIRFLQRRLGYIPHNFNMKFRIVADGRTALSNLELDHD